MRDRHIDHGKASDLVTHACFLSGLERLETYNGHGKKQSAFRPQHVFHYIQWDEKVEMTSVRMRGALTPSARRTLAR